MTRTDNHEGCVWEAVSQSFCWHNCANCLLGHLNIAEQLNDSGLGKISDSFGVSFHLYRFVSF